MSTEEKYIEVAIRIKWSDFYDIDKEVHKKMWNTEDPIIHLDMDCEVLAFGVDGFITRKLELEG